MNRLWVVAYDIKDDSIRRKVYQTLSNVGEPVQYSVFECWLREDQLNDVREQVQLLIDKADSIRWYPLCVWCRKKVDFQGVGSESQDPPYVLL